MMGTLEYQGSKADAFKVSNDLVTNGVYCQARPDLAYTTTDAQERVVSFRLIEEPKQLTSASRDRIEAAIAKRARRAARRQASVPRVATMAWTYPLILAGAGRRALYCWVGGL